jgi:hypothetical protein
MWERHQLRGLAGERVITDFSVVKDSKSLFGKRMAADAIRVEDARMRR